MRVKRNGVCREVSETLYNTKFKALGYVIVEGPAKEKELDEELIRAKAKEMGISHYWNKSIETLIQEGVEA